MYVLATSSELDNRKHGFFPPFLAAEISQEQYTKDVHVSSADFKNQKCTLSLGPFSFPLSWILPFKLKLLQGQRTKDGSSPIVSGNSKNWKFILWLISRQVNPSLFPPTEPQGKHTRSVHTSSTVFGGISPNKNRNELHQPTQKPDRSLVSSAR